MSQDNKIAVVVAPADKASVIQKAGEIATLTPWRVNIPAGDKNKYTVISTGRAGMDDVFVNQMTAHPELVPSYVDMTEVQKDINFRKDVAELLAALTPIVEGLQDAALLASSDCFNAFSAFKHSVDTAAARNVAGADTIKAALDQFFPG